MNLDRQYNDSSAKTIECPKCGSFEFKYDTYFNENICKNCGWVQHIKSEKNLKCKTCGFVAFGNDQQILKNKKCLNCGNIIGEEPVKKQSSSTNESLLETCQNCGHSFSTRATQCPKCSQARLLECFVCKKQIPQSSQACPECGDPAPFEQQSTTGKSSCNITVKNKSTECEKTFNVTNPKTPLSTNYAPLGFLGFFVIIMAVLYGVWAGVMAYSVNGKVLIDTVKLHGALNTEQVQTLLQDPNFSNELSEIRKANKTDWFIIRHASMLIFSLLVAWSLLRRWPTATNWLAFLAISIPISMIIVIVGTPTDKISGVGMIINSMLAGVFWAILWWLFKRQNNKIRKGQL